LTHYQLSPTVAADFLTNGACMLRAETIRHATTARVYLTPDDLRALNDAVQTERRQAGAVCCYHWFGAAAESL
jgi:hypothetical protein